MHPFNRNAPSKNSYLDDDSDRDYTVSVLIMMCSQMRRLRERSSAAQSSRLSEFGLCVRQRGLI
jgi:hypothetical protein